MFNPQWKARKERQAKLFGNAAIGQADQNNYSQSNGIATTNTGEDIQAYTQNNSNAKYTNNFNRLDYSPEDQKKNFKLTGNNTPFVAKKHQTSPGFTKTADGKGMTWSDVGRKGEEHGKIVNPWSEDFRQENGKGMGKTLTYLNRAYNSGRGETKPNSPAYQNFRDIKPLKYESRLNQIVSESIAKILDDLKKDDE